MGRRGTSLTQGETVRSLRAKLAELEALDAELSKRMAVEDPRTYGLPDLLRPRDPQETQKQFAARQDRELRDFIQENLTVLKDGERRPILITPKMLEFLAGMFYRRTPLGIVWKGRGAGGSFCTAILMFLCLVYHRMSFTNMAGAQEQAKIIYRYTKDFWDCFPDLKNGLLDGEPLQTETRLKTGAMIKTITASEKQTRGKHNPGLIIDESCQEAENVDRLIMAAMQNAMSEPNHMVVMVSTFHHPVGLFQEVWDYAEEKGFARYQWSVFDSMTKCEDGLDTATRDDPKALEFCKNECPLTWQKTVVDDFGNMIGEVEKGCAGTARDGEGFLPRKTVMAAQQMNKGTNVFEIEYGCERPDWMSPVYHIEWIERSYCDPEWPPPGTRVVEKSVGIDWGLEGQTALVLSALLEVPTSAVIPEGGGLPSEPPFKRCIGILDTHFMTGQLVPEAIKVLWTWVEQYGQENFFVYPDISHPFNNLELEQAGFDARPVPFNKWKDYGVGNVTKFFTSPERRLRVRKNQVGLIEQLKRYRFNRQGKPIKKDDHGPDALLSYLDGRTKVMTPDGWAPVKDLGVGSQVLTHRGRFRPITRYAPAPYKKGKQVVVNFAGRTHSVDAHRVTLEHPFLLADGRWVEAEHLQPGDRVACLAARCAGCGEKVPWFRKTCEECAGKVRNKRWERPGEREQEEREQKRQQLREDCYEFTAIEVASVRIEPLKRAKRAYHFEVDEDQSYVARGVVSHNCAMLHYNFEDMFALDFEAEEGEVPEPLLNVPDRRVPQFEGAAPPTTHVPALPPQANRTEITYPKKRTSDDGQVIAL